MKNWEKYESKIKEIGVSGFGVNKEKIDRCANIGCAKCEFIDDNDRCSNKLRTEWLYSDYTEPKPTITSKEKAFLEAIYEESAFIARDNDETLMVYLKAPKKYDDGWSCYPDHFAEIAIKQTLFPFITWEDIEPWSVEELLKLEVEDEY